MKQSKYYISFDDYSPLNLKIADLLESIGFPYQCIFFIETGSPEAMRQIEELHERGFEIGCHTISHPSDMKLLSIIQAKTEIETSKLMIEDVTGVPCEWFAYPRGRFNEEVVKLVKDAGFKYARTTRVLETDEDGAPFKLGTAVHVYNGREEYKDRSWFEMGKFHLDHVRKNGGTFHLWGHANEIERDHLWDELEEFLTKMAND